MQSFAGKRSTDHLDIETESLYQGLWISGGYELPNATLDCKLVNARFHAQSYDWKSPVNDPKIAITLAKSGTIDFSI